MLSKIIFNILVFYFVGCLPTDTSDAGPTTDLTPDEASHVAQSFLEAGLEGFTLLRIHHFDEDIDSCNLIRTSTYEVQLQSTGEVFEISSESNITNASNCRRKHKLMQAISQARVTRVQCLGKITNDTLKWEEMSIEQFQEEMSTIVQEDFRIVTAKHSYRFAEENGAEFDTELIELLVQIINSGKEYLVNIEGKLDFDGQVIPRTYRYPPKVLLSLLGGGRFSKIKRKS
ncbi:uncharacterized protein LOC135706501 [Ochlerotatus camptorhynchus]|uniref:uncharacterized protein LOC135706501 n=1 Tax=Ochlerotatus camptorhynchus TaxID=644619 RepID=UPI0031DA619E